MKIENWNGNAIRFIWHKNEWWAMLKDVCDALELKNPTVVSRRLERKEVTKFNLGSQQGEILITTELGIYQAIFQSRKKEAKDFQHWTYTMLKNLREASGLQGFEVFRTLDKEHQKEMMAQLQNGLKEPKQIDFIKANTIANKTVSTMHGYQKMVKKAEMTPVMLQDREKVLGDVVNLMEINEKFNLNISIKDVVRSSLRPTC